MPLRYPCVRQRDVQDCGAACLATVALAHGRRYSLARVRDAVRTDLRGTTAMGLLEGAGQLGLSAQGVEASFDALPEVPLPAIAHWKEAGLAHFVVVHRVTPRHVIVADPARGVRRMEHDEFRAHWTGILILAVPDDELGAAEPSEAIWRRLLRLQFGERGTVARAAIAAVVVTLLGLATAFYVRLLVDQVLPAGDVRLLHALGLGMLLILLLRTSLTSLRDYFLMHAGQRIYSHLFSSYYRHLLHLPMRFYDTRRVGELTSRLSDSARVRVLLTDTTAAVGVDVVMVVSAAAAMLVFDPVLTLIALAALPIFAALAALLAGPYQRRQREALEAGAELNAVLVEAVAGADTVKALTAERPTVERVDERLLASLRAQWTAGKLHIGAIATSTVIAGGVTLAVLWAGGLRVIGGTITTGELMGFYALAVTFLAPLQRLVDSSRLLQESLVAAERVWEILDLDLEEQAGHALAPLGECRGHVVLENVTFAYGSRDPVLHGVTLEVRPGETVALVGESGSGKSTIARLLQGFYHPQHGRVLLDGRDVRTIPPRSLRSFVGAVPQDPLLFRGTIAENIALGTEGPIDGDRIHEAAHRAGADEFILRLADGYFTEVGERGSGLSTGQRQRIAIARALYREAPILVLDEVTSALDARAEELVRDTLRALHGTHTVLLIAHRLSTTVHADRILVLRGGRLVEEGPHAELLARGGEYFELWRRQADAAVEAA